MTADRVLLTLAVAGLGVGLSLLMLRGWRSRARHQAGLPPPPAPPADPGDVVVAAVPGLFVGTTTAQDWLDRVAVHGLSHRSTGWLTVHRDGVLVEREGGVPLWLAPPDLLAAAPGEGLAGKVVGRDGLLLLQWRLGAQRLTSAFRADDATVHRRLAETVTAQIVGAPVERGLTP